MHIAFFSHSSQLEGAPKFILRLALACKNSGHTCTVYTREEAPLNDLIRNEGIEVIVINNLLQNTCTLPDITADVCIVNTITAFRLLQKIREYIPNAKLLWCIHESRRKAYEEELTGFSQKHYSYPDCIIFPSEKAAANYKDAPAKNMLTIPNGLDTHTIQKRLSGLIKPNIRREYGIPTQAIVISIIGTINELKGQREFVEAALMLIKKYPYKPLHFVIAGRCTDYHAHYRDTLIRKIADYGVQHQFTFLPAHKDPIPYFALSDIFVCASYTETLPYIVMEAMACKLPIVASDSYGVSELIEDRVSGLTVLPAHSLQIAERLSYLIEHPHVAQRIADAALRRVEKLFSIEKMYENYAQLFTPPVRKSLKEKPKEKKWIHKALYKLWLFAGSPAPKLARHIRYNILKPVWPVLHEAVSTEKKPSTTTQKNTEPKVAVIIPCNNYGRFLGEAIESVLQQTLTPQQIVVVDDSSTDNTESVAKKYASKDVEFIRGNWGNVGKARNAGMDKTTADFLVFLDADDVLHPQYLACGVQALQEEPQAGVAYANSQMFGSNDLLIKTPDAFSAEIFDRHNHINSISTCRRTALMQAGGWAEESGQHLDWLTWRRVMQLGWKAVKSEGLHFYRQHNNNMFHSYRNRYSYVERSGLFTEPTTLFIALSGRKWMWPLTAKYLESQLLDHNQIHLVLIDTSQNEEFGNMVRSWLSSCDYKSTTYHQLAVGRPGLADLPRDQVTQQVRDAVAQIYNTCARLCTTATACFLEDDILPPLNAFPRLLSQIEPDVIAVSGYYCHRGTTNAIAWNWKDDGLPFLVSPQEGTTVIGGTGFGCLVMRGMYLQRTVFSSGPPRYNYDHNFFFDIHNHPRHKALIDWSIRCQHHSSPTDWS